jgi:hypothetical protein
LFFVLCLAGAAVAVFFFAASITKSDLSASDIDAKLNASTNAIAKLTKDHEDALQNIGAREKEVADKIKEVGERFAEMSSPKPTLLREKDAPASTTLDLSTEPTTLDHFSQIILLNLQNPNSDGSITRALLFRGNFAVGLRSSLDGWQRLAKEMKDYAPLVQALDTYQSALKKDKDVLESLNLNQLAYRKLYDKKSDAVAGLLTTRLRSFLDGSFFNRNQCHTFWDYGNNYFSHFTVNVIVPIQY